MGAAKELACLHGKNSTSDCYLRYENSTQFCFPANISDGATGFFKIVGIVSDDDNPLNYNFASLLLQASMVLLLSRFITFVLKPLRTPRVVSELIAGVIVGPSVVGRSKAFASLVLYTTRMPITTMYSARSKYVLECISKLALTYFFFLVGVRQDPLVMIRGGRKAVVSALSGLLLPLVITTGFFLLTNAFSLSSPGVPVLLFITSLCSISPFGDVSKALEELNLLSSELGKLAISSALVYDIVAWAMVVVSMAMQLRSMKAFMGTIVSFVLFLVFLFYVSQPSMLWIIRRTRGKHIREVYMVVLLASVLVIGFVSDVNGVSAPMGALLYGLFIPSGPPLGSAITEKLDSLVNGLFMPIFYTVVGFRVDPFSITELDPIWIILQLVILVGFVGKLLATLVSSLHYDMTPRDSFLLGLFMNTKGIVEVSYLMNLFENKIIDTATFTILLLPVLVTASIISPIVSIFYDPQVINKQVHYKRTLQNSGPGSELTVLASFHHLHNVPTLINLIELAQPTRMAPIYLYPVHLVELKARASPLVIAHTATTSDMSDQLQPQSETGSIVNAFKKYAKHRTSLTGGIFIQTYTAIAPFSTMDLEINTLAEEKKASLILIPFHQPMSSALRALNNSLLESAPCSVGIIIDRGLGVYSARDVFRVVVLFHGGVDDREALWFAVRMAGHTHINLTVIRLIPSDGYDLDEKDEQLLNGFRLSLMDNTRAAYEERELGNVQEMVAAIREMGNACDLFVVGRGGWDGSSLVMGLHEWSEWSELGVIGDMLASSDYTASVLVVQQYLDSHARDKNLKIQDSKYLINNSQEPQENRKAR